MAADETCIRVTRDQLASFVGRPVRIIGHVLSIEGERVTLESADKGQMIVTVTGGLSVIDPAVTQHLEIAGRVNEDSSIVAALVVPISVPFDLEVYENAVKLSHKHHELFY